MSNIRNLVLCFLSTLLLSSCWAPDSEVLRLSSTSVSGLVPPTTAIVFTFSHAVVPSDSTNIWSSEPYVEFTPPIEGKFVWQDSARLVFSPDAPLPGDTKFKGRLNTDLLVKLSGAKSFRGDEEIKFYTEAFFLHTADFFYDRIDNKRSVGVRVNLEFTYAVNPTDLAKYLELQVNGEEHKGFHVVATEPNKVMPVEIGTLTQLEKPMKIEINIDKDMVSPETKTQLTMDKPFVFTLPGIGELQIYGHEFGFDGTESWIRIKTSQDVDPATAKSFIDITPARTYKISAEEKQGVVIRGNFEPGSSFHLSVRQGLESILGAKTKNLYEADIIIGNVKPAFSFISSSGVYMLLGGAKTIEFKTINLPKLYVRVSQIFQNNLVHFLDQGRHYDYDYEYDDEGNSTYKRKYRYAIGNYGRQLEAKYVDVKSNANGEVITPFDLSSYLRNDYKGFYLVEISNPSDQWRSTAKLISVSDLGIIVKRSNQTSHIFVVSLETNSPVSGATVNLISTNNQVIGSLKTDGDGLARFDNTADVSPGFSLKMVTVEKDGDFNFINLSDYEIETSKYDVGGKRDVAGVYDAFLYGDRDLYRPGEKVFASGIIRMGREKLEENMPIRLKISNPKGTVLTEIQKTLNEEGSFEASYQTSPTALTGEYRMDLYAGNGTFLATRSVSVEDFVPDRMKINLTASKASARPGETVKYDFTALNFFGPPAAGRNWEFEGSYEAMPYRSKQFSGFRFADDAATNYSANAQVLEGKTDNEGKSTVEIEIPKNVTATGVLRMRGRVGVFDESGRPVYQVAQTTVFPKDYAIGLDNQGDYYVSPRTPQKVLIVAVDLNDKPINGFRAKVDLIRLEWHSVLRMHAETKTLRYVSEQKEVNVKSEEVLLKDTPVEYFYSVERSGDYIVRVSKVGDSGYNQFEFYSYSWGTSDITSFEINPEARIEMVFDKPVYAPGDRAKILFKAPFNGTMLVTVERNKLNSYKYLTVEKNSASMEVDLKDEYLPNVYVTATLFRKIKDLQLPLMVGHGFEPLLVEKPSNHLDVTITAPEKMRPKTKQSVTVHIPDQQNVFVTLAAVDEGICQLKNYRTPDPYGFFYTKKALQTNSYDFFRDLIPEYVKEKKQESSVGGGDEEAMAKRASPFGVKRFKPVALWSGIVKTNSSGDAEVTLDVPEFSGELRLMALAYKGESYGSAHKAMKVSDPVVITPALPRFLSPNDVMMMPITAFNTTDKPASLKFRIETQGGIVADKNTATLEVDANQERYVGVTLRATDQIGKAVVKVKTEAFGEKLESITELPIRPIAPFVSEVVGNFVEGGTPVSQDVGDNFLSYGRRSYVTLSPFPVVKFAKQLKYLVGYPHGCLEQTTSKAFPQVYLRDIAILIDPSILDKGSPTYFVNEAITKIASMQRDDGAFDYWPGGGWTNTWTTVYATHFLVECKKAGYAVPEATLKSALSAITQIARNKETMDYSYYANNRVTIKRIADKSSVYALYVLAAAGQPETSVMNFYRTSRVLLTNDTQYLLGGAFALSGDQKTSMEILPKQFELEEAQRTSGGWYDSPVRANAIILNVLLATDPNSPNIPRYMDYLSKIFDGYYWYSTQDAAFTLLGFGKAARLAGGAKLKGQLTVNGKKLSYDGGNKKFDVDVFGKNVSLSLSGEGRVYYSIVTEGIRKDGKVKIEDKNLRIRREFFDRNGSQVNLDGIRENSLVIVKLTLTADVDQLDNIAITDMLPGGFEIENPRLTETTQYPFIKGETTPQYVDIRDDRINYYTSLDGSRQQVFYYMVRAVSRGEFQYAPVVAEAMYDGSYYSASGQTKIRVVER